MSTRRPEDDLGILLGLAYQRFVAELNTHLAAAGFAGIGSSFGYVFRILLDGELTTSQLAGRLGITAQGAAKLVNEMTGNGYVARRPDPGDARQKQVRLTARGRAAVAAARAFHEDFERQLAAELGARSVATLRKVLGTVVDRDHAGDLARVLRPT